MWRSVVSILGSTVLAAFVCRLCCQWFC